MKRSLLFSVLLFLAVTVILVGVFSAVSGNYVLRIDSPGDEYDLVTVSYTDDSVLNNVGAFELDGSMFFVMRGLDPGSCEVDVMVSSYETGEIGVSEHFSDLRVNSLGMVYQRSLGNDFQYWQLIFVGIAVYFLIMGVWFLRRYRTQRAENPFNYQVVFDLTLALMCLLFAAVFALSALLLMTRFTELPAPEAFSLVSIFVILLIGLSLPPALIVSVLVGISNLSLIRHEGFRPVNALGIAMGTLLSVGIAALLIGTLRNRELLEELALFRTAVNIAALIILFLELTMVSVTVCALRSLRSVPPFPQDYIIILGCGIRPDGTLYPLLRGRVDRALSFYREQLAAGEKAPILVPSGGQGGDEPMAEAEAMQRYLISEGVPAGHILPETRSGTTRENMLFSKEIIRQDGRGDRVIFSTTAYHVFRSGMLAAEAGLRAAGIGSPTRWYFWPNAFLREFVGIVVAYRRAELGMGLSMAVLVTIITNLQSILNAIS